ncbi:MAG: formimidoylglutamate deiminase [Planctomycetota bacterium]
MARIFAHTALLPEGWCENVSIEVGDDGTIANVEHLAEEHPADCEYKVDILLPSPVNVHSHAFQRAMAGLSEHRGTAAQDDFWTWRKLMYQFLERITPEDMQSIAALVQMEMLEAGYATNVEFHYVHHQADGTPYDNSAELSERILAASTQTGIGLTLLPVLYQYGGCDQRELSAGQVRFGNDVESFLGLHEKASQAMRFGGADANIGVAPHSQRAVGADDLKYLATAFADAPIHLHLAEQRAEVAEVQAALGRRPVEWLLDNIDVHDRWCLIHCTQMEPHETSGLAATHAVAGLCPITESSLGDGIFDGLNWVEAGGRIAIGSDSNIRISLCEETRTLDYSQRLRDRVRAPFAASDRSSGRVLFEAIVAGGAQAAGRATGRIETGNYADLISLDASSVHLVSRSGDQLLDGFIYAGDDTLVQDVWSAGRHMVQAGRHRNREEIVNAFLATQRKLIAS